MRRSYRILRERLSARIAKAVSPADGPGYIYHYFNSWFSIKVGRSVNVARRRREWDRVCWNPLRKWKTAIWCSNAHRAGKDFQRNLRFTLRSAESIAHILLEQACVDRPSQICATCKLDPYFSYNYLILQAANAIARSLCFMEANALFHNVFEGLFGGLEGCRIYFSVIVSRVILHRDSRQVLVWQCR